MELKKPYIFLKSLPNKLNRFYIQRSKSKLLVKNKSKKKNEFNPVTNLDKSFEKLIRKLILKSFINDGIKGEEFKEKHSNNDFQWSIDPIDGTKAFVIGVPTWSNLISLSFKKKTFIGLANFPELNRFYINDKKKTYLFKNKKRKILKSSSKNNLKEVKMIGAFHGKKSEIKKKIIKKFEKMLKLVSFDALNYCLLAEGKVDVVIETNLKSYDIRPLIPIVKNSGGYITNWKNESPEEGGNILATSNKILHKRILKMIKPFSNLK